MATGMHWEWRGFGAVSYDFANRFCNLTDLGPSSQWPDIYVWIQNLRVNTKYRDNEAEKGLKFVEQQLAMDKGARQLGEFSLTDKRFSRIDRFMANTLFDENFGGKYGNSHIALGASYTNTFAGNQADLTKALKRKLGFNDSSLHWDFVNTQKKRVIAHLKSGKKITIYENGKFAY